MPSIALGQSSNSVSDPAQIEQRIHRPQPKRSDAPPPNIEVTPAEPTPTTDAKFSFVLSAVVIEGATVFTPERLALLYGKFLARTVTEAEVQEIAKSITKLYRDAGYVFSQADVPPQEVLGGVLKIAVTEGYIEQVKYDDDKSGKSFIADYMAPVLEERPVRLQTIERALLLINDLNGVALADTSIADGGAPGARILNVKLDHSPFNADVYLDNRGTPSSGRLQGWVSGAANGLLSVGDRAQIGLFTIPDSPEELIYIQGQWTQPLGGAGTTAQLSISGSTVDAGANLSATNTESDSFRVQGTLRHPILRTRKNSLWATGELDYYNVNEDQSGAENFKDRNRAVRLGLEYYGTGILNGDFYAKAAYARGLDVFGASNENSGPLSRSDGKADFNKATLDLRRVQKLFGGVSLLAQTKGQWSSGALLTAEEFAVGGSQYGRAFDFSEIVGDKGVAGLLELRYTGKNPTSWIDSYELYLFYDAGAVWNKGSTRDVLTSAGGGVRTTVRSDFYADLQVAQPLNRVVSTEGNKDVRVLFSIGAGF